MAAVQILKTKAEHVNIVKNDAKAQGDWSISGESLLIANHFIY